MECVSCGEDRPIAARGLCRNCYSRWRRNGSANFVRPLKDGFCTVEGCGQRVHGQGLCTKHLQRLRRTGTTDEGRSYQMQKKPEDMRSQHDLYPIWREFSRPKNRRPVVPQWLDFDAFVADVMHRPGRRFRLYPIVRGVPMGPGNYEWKEALVAKLPGEDRRAYNKRQQTAHKAAYPAAYKDANLRRFFGPDFGFEQFAIMAEKQNNLCAICGQREAECDKNGKVKELATDHDHVSGKIRELLCAACNTGLGKFKHDPILLGKAIAYLAKHGSTLETQLQPGTTNNDVNGLARKA